jgi:hypothetical protein
MEYLACRPLADIRNDHLGRLPDASYICCAGA